MKVVTQIDSLLVGESPTLPIGFVPKKTEKFLGRADACSPLDNRYLLAFFLQQPPFFSAVVFFVAVLGISSHLLASISPPSFKPQGGRTSW
ncbi:MAG: hypothetical protein N3B10_11285, partial [Armatimonadetes bacterium]|nr:hypothetical protein [Armatimonadota bacterium]